MPATILLKRSTTAGAVPSLVAGELARNIPDELLYFRNPGGVATPLKLPDCEKLITRGIVTNAASLVLSVDPAVIGIMRMFVLHLTDWRAASSGNRAMLRFGDSTSIKSGSSNYEWGQLYGSIANGGFQSSAYDRSDSKVLLTDAEDTSASYAATGTIWFGTNDSASVVENWSLSNIASLYNFSGFFAFQTFSIGTYNGRLALTQVALQQESGNITTGRYELIGIP